MNSIRFGSIRIDRVGIQLFPPCHKHRRQDCRVTEKKVSIEPEQTWRLCMYAYSSQRGALKTRWQNDIQMTEGTYERERKETQENGDDGVKETINNNICNLQKATLITTPNLCARGFRKVDSTTANVNEEKKIVRNLPCAFLLPLLLLLPRFVRGHDRSAEKFSSCGIET